MSYNPEEILQKMRQNRQPDQFQQPSQQQQQQQIVLEKNVIEELFRKINMLETHVQSLEGNLSHAQQEISILRNQKLELEEQVLRYEVDKEQTYFQDRGNDEVGYEIVDAISREPVEKALQRKEKKFNRFANGNNQPKSKPAGHLKLDQLNQILQEYPNLARPIIHIKLTDADFE